MSSVVFITLVQPIIIRRVEQYSLSLWYPTCRQAAVLDESRGERTIHCLALSWTILDGRRRSIPPMSKIPVNGGYRYLEV